MKGRVPAEVATLPGLVAWCASRWGEREALITVDERWSYARLARETARVAEGLAALGVGPGDRVGVLLPNRPEFFASVFGIQATGAAAVCLNTMAPEAELAFHVAHTRLDTVVYVPSFLKHDYVARLDALTASGEAAGFLQRRIAVVEGSAGSEVPPGSLDYAALGSLPEDGPSALRALDHSTSESPAAIFFTSGSTAKPKALVHAHRSLVHQAFVAGDAFGIEAEDRAWGGLPMFFTGGFVVIGLLSLAAGGAVVLQDHFEAATALDLMERERITVYAGWQLAAALCEHESFPRRRLRLRKGMYAETPVTETLLAPDHVSIAGYGLSETATTICAARWDDPPDVRKRGFGRPLPGAEVAIVDPETGAPRPEGEVGEVRVRGPSLMLGYLGVAREEYLDARGFFRTGDFGRLDDTGTLHFEGRLKEVIKTAGVNVAAAEVEACLEALPFVRAAYVVPVAHPVRGENVAAFLVTQPGVSLPVDAVLEHCRTALAPYKVPRHLFRLDPADVPRTGTQKVDKPRLREDAGRQAGGAIDLLFAKRDG